MAINVNTVYQTVLSILNKEQRGFLTPSEFNKLASQVQLDIFEKYFEDLNQQMRVPQADDDYSDRLMNLDEKVAIFKTFGEAIYNTSTNPKLKSFSLPTVNEYGQTVDFYRLGTVTYNPSSSAPTEVQRLTRTEFYNIDKSDLTLPSENYPVYLYENQGNVNIPGQAINSNIQNVLYVKPLSIIDDIEVDYIRKPIDPIWGFTTGTRGQYIFTNSYYDTSDGTGSIDFELHESEQVNVILRILSYAGIIIRDPQIVQAASSEVQQNEINQKS